MEQESRNRRRRSIRHLRRSSGLYTDSFTPSSEVEELKADSHDDNLVSVYGSIWVDNDRLGQNADSLATCRNDTARHYMGKDSIDIYPSHGKQADLSPSPQGCEFPEGLLNAGDDLNEHQSLTGGHFGAQFLSNVVGADPIDVPSLSSYSPDIFVTWHRQSSSQPVEHVGLEMSCGGESCPQTTHVLSAHSSNSLQRNITDDPHLVQENLSLSKDDKVCVIKDKRLHANVCQHDSIILKDSVRVGNESVKTVFKGEVTDSSVTETISDLQNDIETSDDVSALSWKDRRKSGRFHEDRRKSGRFTDRPDTIKDSEMKPKKRKRLSLRKIQQDSADTQTENVSKHVETSDDIKLSIIEESENEIIETFEKEIITHELNNYILHFTSDSELNGTNKCLDNLEIVNCVDHVNFAEIDIEKDFFFQDFQPVTHEKKSKRSSQSKARAARRSSRVFQPCEMPLCDLSLEENHDLELPSLKLHNYETNSSLSAIRSPEYSEIMNGSSRDKENIPDMNVCTTGQIQKLPEVGSNTYLHSAGRDLLSVQDSTLVEGVVADFANLCMHEKTATHGDECSKDLGQVKSSDGRTVLYETVNTIDADVYRCTDTYVDKSDILDMYPHVDTISACNNLLDSSTSPENISSEREMSFHGMKWTMDYEEQNSDVTEQNSDITEQNSDITKDPQSLLDTAFSTAAADVDIEELLSPDEKPAEYETDDSVISDHAKCKRLRRGRKSWDTNQQQHAVSIKKPARRKSKQGNQEDENKLVDLNNTDKSISGPVTEQSDGSEQDAISPGLLSLYQNKNFVAPQPRSWQTIKESPKSSHFLFSKQQQKCFLEFENGITRAKLQRRHKKALEVYKTMGGLPAAISHTEFEQKMLDIQLSIDSI